MKACIVCRGGEIGPGQTTLTVERGRMTLVLKGVPARVCASCGEAYFDEATTARVEALSNSSSGRGFRWQSKTTPRRRRLRLSSVGDRHLLTPS